MRERCVDFMVEHRDDFEPFIDETYLQQDAFSKERMECQARNLRLAGLIIAQRIWIQHAQHSGSISKARFFLKVREQYGTSAMLLQSREGHGLRVSA